MKGSTHLRRDSSPLEVGGAALLRCSPSYGGWVGTKFGAGINSNTLLQFSIQLIQYNIIIHCKFAKHCNGVELIVSVKINPSLVMMRECPCSTNTDLHPVVCASCGKPPVCSPGRGYSTCDLPRGKATPTMSAWSQRWQSPSLQ